jgi:hypothetical protein
MGTTTSAVLTPEQNDLAFLGERFPFGNAEFKHLYRAYHAIQALPPTEHSSFLVEWAVACTDSSPGIAAAINTADESIDELRAERQTLLQAVEQNILPPNFGNRLYETAFLVAGDASLYASCETKSTTGPEVTDAYTHRARLERFFQGLSDSGRRGTKAAMTVLFGVCQAVQVESVATSNNVKTTTIRTRRVRATEFVDMGYRLALATAFLQAADTPDGSADMAAFLKFALVANDATLQALASSIVEWGKRRLERAALGLATSKEDEDPNLQQGFVELEDILEWASEVAPVFASILPTFTFHIFFPGRSNPPSRTAFDFPRILSKSIFFEAPTSPLLFTFGCLSSSLNGSYYRLYTSAADGLSFNRLQNSLLGYAGPTLLIIRAVSGGIFGAFTASQWKEAKDFYGNTDCFLFQMAPVTAVYRPTGSNSNFMYCNSNARSKGYDQQAHGIGFGGTVQEPRFFVEESFDNCVAGNRDLTFENGVLLPKTASGGVRKHFEIHALEVWGVGGDDVVQQALGARAEARSVKDEAMRRARKVDKAAFLDDFRSGVIESKAFQHVSQVQGRADHNPEERTGKSGYEYAK